MLCWRNPPPFGTPSTRGQSHMGIGIPIVYPSVLSTCLATIQTTCPWTLRDLRCPHAPLALYHHSCHAYIHQGDAKEIVSVIRTEEYQNTDPPALHQQLAAQFELAFAYGVFQDDFFVAEFKDEFAEAERSCERRVSTDTLAHRYWRFGASDEPEGEKRIVNPIRETRMGADANIGPEKVRYGLSFYIFLDFPWTCPSSYHRRLLSFLLSFFLVYTFRSHRAIPCSPNSPIISLSSYLKYFTHNLRPIMNLTPPTCSLRAYLLSRCHLNHPTYIFPHLSRI